MAIGVLLRSKLFRPPTTRDVVHRRELLERLDANMHLRLTLVSAPAGYGKSTLVSDWLDSHPGPSAWVSIEETENDPLMLLSYVVAALQGIYPDAFDETQALLEASAPPSITEIVTSLINELDDLETDIVLVLDDFHRIHNPDVHDELLSLLLQQLPRALHVVIITRIDPPLPLGRLRAQHLLSEIRVRDLEFDEGEAGTFLRQATGRSISDLAVARVFQQVEGWAVGLRLTALALQHQGDLETFLENFDGDLHQVREFLLEEVLSQQTPEYREFMRKTSVLNRFCAPLCDAVCATDESDESGTGSAFVRFLDDRGMLCIPLDEKKGWYRYHHLFQELLYSQLKDNSSPKEIATLHRCAARWLEDNGWLDEAFDHTLRGDSPVAAGRMIVRHRNLILNEEQWHFLDRWLDRLPAEVRKNDPELLILEAWRCQNRGRYPQLYALLDRIDELLASRQCESCEKSCDVERVQGGVDALRTKQRYDEGRGELAAEHAEQALKRLPEDCASERGYAIVMRSGALQMCGQLEDSRKALYDLLSDASMPIGTYRARVLIALCFIDWIAADLPAVRRAASECLAIGETHGLDESVALGRFFLGMVHYHKNELSEAEATLAPVTVLKGAPNLEYLAENVFILASAQQAAGQADKATATANAFAQHLLNLGNANRLERTEAYLADLALRQGRTAEAMAWAQRFDPEPLAPQSDFFAPQLTLAKALIAEGSEQSFERAANLLARLEAFYEQIHSTRFLIEALALRALLHDAKGDEPAAREALGRAVSLAQPSGFIRLFVDLGPGLPRLLSSLDLDEERQRYLEQILSAFPTERESQPGAPLEQRAMRRSTPPPPQPLASALTFRELEVLGLLSERLSGQEIADRLCISTKTVKRHAGNIYSKLGVAGRRQAVAKATELAILGAPSPTTPDSPLAG